MSAKPNWTEQVHEDPARLRDADLCNVMDAIPAMVWIASPDGKGTHINRAWTEYLGLSLEDTVGFGWTKTVHPDDIDRYLAAWRLSLATGQALDEEVRYRRAADGQYRWFLSRGIPVRDEHGNILKWFGVGTDIEDRKQAEEAARKREKELCEVLEQMPAMAFAVLADGTHCYVSNQWKQYTGFSAAETDREGWARAIHPEDVERHLEKWHAAVAAGQQFDSEARLRRADGKYRWFLIRATPLRDENGTITKWYGFLTDIHEGKQTQEALARSEKELSNLIAHMPGMAWVVLPDGRHPYVSTQFQEYTGLSAQECDSDGWIRVVHPDDLEEHARAWHASLAKGTAFEHEARFRRASDGEYRWIIHRATPLRDGTGKIDKWYGISTDIEDRKRAQEALQRSEKELRDLIENMPALALALLPDGSHLYLTKQWTEYTGLSIAETDYEGWARTVHPDDVERHIKTWRACAETGQPFESEARFRRADGIYRWFLVRATPLRDGTGNIAKWHGILTDIEDRKRADEKLRENEFYLAEAQKLSKTGSWAASRGYPGIRFWSEECYRVLGFDPRAGLPTFDEFFQRIHPDDQPIFSEVGDKAIAQKAAWELDYRILHQDGRYRDIHVLGHPVLGPTGDLVEFVGTVIDITERKRLRKLEAELAHMNRVSVMGEMAASLAHEIKQPIAAATTNAQICLWLLEREQLDVSEMHEATSAVVQSVKRAADIIDRVRSLSKKTTQDRELIDVNQVIREIEALLRNESRLSSVTMNLKLSDSVPRVRGDRVQLQQVVMNLMINAIEAMTDSGGELVVTSELTDTGRALISVTDSGVGIPEDKQEQIFDAFFTTKAQGTGMGLAISRSIIESHGGRLWAEGNTERGATFHFELPQYAPEPA